MSKHMVGRGQITFQINIEMTVIWALKIQEYYEWENTNNEKHWSYENERIKV